MFIQKKRKWRNGLFHGAGKETLSEKKHDNFSVLEVYYIFMTCETPDIYIYTHTYVTYLKLYHILNIVQTDALKHKYP